MKQFIFILMFLFVFDLKAQSMKPGVWKTKSNLKVNGIPLPSNEDQNCVLPKDAKDIKAALVKNLQKDGCSLDKWTVKGQNIVASLACKNNELDASGTLQGTFSLKNYKLAGEANGTYRNMLPAVASFELEGEWLKACK